MIVTLKDIKKAFSDLENGSRSYEEIASFASAAMQADDAGLLHIEPQSEAHKVWAAITYLTGVDIKETSDSYLHCAEDFLEFRASIGLEDL